MVELPNQEYEVLQLVQSDNVVKPIVAAVYGNRHVLITPFIEGDNLQKRLAQTKTFDETEVYKLAESLINVANALYHAGVLHLDIKPANIIISDDGKYYLVDFGAARFLKRMRQEKIKPARSFIAPEVLTYLFDSKDIYLQQISILADMYSLGAVLYAVATGHNLTDFFKSSTDILNRIPPPVRTYNQDFNSDLAKLIDKLVSKQPANRPLPEDALKIMRHEPISKSTLPIYFLRTKPRGEHKDIIPVLSEQKDTCAVYWASDNKPNLGDKSTVPKLLWETLVKSRDELADDLLRQHEFDCLALVVPGNELENPLKAVDLKNNIELIETGVEWRNKMAIDRDVLTIVPLDEAILISNEISQIKNAYAACPADGIILRICAPSNNFNLDIRHMKAIEDFIRPWIQSGKVVLFDGDLSIIPLLACGVHGFVATTYPRLTILTRRRIRPSFITKPDGMYVSRFLNIIGVDNVMILRGQASGRLITNCDCPTCAANFMKRNRLPAWTRPDRRKHFVYALTKDMKAIKEQDKAAIKKRVDNALNEIQRFPYVNIKQDTLKLWQNFLAN